MNDTDRIVKAIRGQFRTFGGDEDVKSSNNPISIAMADEPLMFAAGVDVKDVVLFVIHAYIVTANQN